MRGCIGLLAIIIRRTALLQHLAQFRQRCVGGHLGITRVATHDGFLNSSRCLVGSGATLSEELIAGLALADTIGGEVEAAYWRGDLAEKRKALMDNWAAYLTKSPAKVVRPRFGRRRRRLT